MLSVKNIIKYLRLLGLGILAYIIYSLDIPHVIQVLRRIDIRLVGLYFLFFFLFYFVKVYRWHILHNHLGKTISYANNVSLNIESYYLGFFTPGRFGDVVKVILMKEYFDIEAKKGIVIYLHDRFQDLFCMCLLAVIGIFFVINYHFPSLLYLVLGLVFMTFIFKNRLINLVRRLFNMSVDMSIDASIEIKMMLLNVVIYALYFLQFYVLARSLGIVVSFTYLSSVVAIAAVLALVPISISGLGIREGTFMFFLSRVGIEKEKAVILSLLDNVVFGILLIIILYLLESNYSGRSPAW